MDTPIVKLAVLPNIHPALPWAPFSNSKHEEVLALLQQEGFKIDFLEHFLVHNVHPKACRSWYQSKRDTLGAPLPVIPEAAFKHLNEYAHFYVREPNCRPPYIAITMPDGRADIEKVFKDLGVIVVEMERIGSIDNEMSAPPDYQI